MHAKAASAIDKLLSSDSIFVDIEQKKSKKVVKRPKIENGKNLRIAQIEPVTSIKAFFCVCIS